MKQSIALTLFLCLLLTVTGCGTGMQALDNKNGDALTNMLSDKTEDSIPSDDIREELYTHNTRISDVISDPVFGDYGRLIFPADSGYYSGDTLGELRSFNIPDIVNAQGPIRLPICVSEKMTVLQAGARWRTGPIH